MANVLVLYIKTFFLLNIKKFKDDQFFLIEEYKKFKENEFENKFPYTPGYRSLQTRTIGLILFVF